MKKTGIVYFAKYVLGCASDNSVFNSIEKEDDCLLDCGVRLDKKIVLGKRLLIYVADAVDIKPADIKNVILEGINERDRNGYNRLRLAIVTPETNCLTTTYLSEFGYLAEKDDRTHIHIVSEENLI